MPTTRGHSRIPAGSALVLLAVLCIAALSGCGGSSEKFSQGEADRALTALDALQSDIDDGRCEDARRYVNRLAVQSTHINEDRPELGEAWASSVARLSALVVRECVEITPTGPTPAATTETGPTETKPDKPTTPTEPDGGSTPGTGGQGGGQDNNQNGGAGGGDQPPPGDSGGDSGGQENSGGAGPGT